MERAITILKYLKEVYSDKDLKHQIDSCIKILNHEDGIKSKKVVELLKAVSGAYEDKDLRMELDAAIAILSRGGK